MDEMQRLAQTLRNNQIDLAFVYVSYLKPTGKFNPTYDHAAKFVIQFKTIAPEIELQAWLGIPVKIPPGIPAAPGYADLDEAQVRQVIAEFSRFTIVDLGFDGVHIDAEHILSGHQAYLTLLDEIRAAIGPQAHLSIASSEITPLLPNADLIVNRWYSWRADFYRQVAARVDQIAVMAYDSHAPSGWIYEQWLRFQVIGLTTELDNAAKIYIGISTSREHSSSHNPDVENMTIGITGLVKGLNDLDARPAAITGVAIYPEWETTEDDWAIYQTLWRGRSEK